MNRYEKLNAFINEHDNISFNKVNIPQIYKNLKKADKDGQLKSFFLNKKEYRSSFTFFVLNDNNKAARGTDQISIVFALNFYGSKTPGFAARLNSILKELANGSKKELKAVSVLMATQMELQTSGISLINFVDTELLTILNAKIKKTRPLMLMLSVLCLVGGAIGMPGLSIAGFPPLSIVAIAVFIYGWLNGVFWLGIKPYTAEFVASAIQPICEYTVEE